MIATTPRTPTKDQAVQLEAHVYNGLFTAITDLYIAQERRDRFTSTAVGRMGAQYDATSAYERVEQLRRHHGEAAYQIVRRYVREHTVIGRRRQAAGE